MAQKRTNPAIFMVVAIGLIGGFVALVQTNPAVHDFFFKQKASKGFYVGPDHLQAITDQIRANKRDEWMEKIRVMYEGVRAIDGKRQSLFNNIKNGAQGEDYLAEFKRLSANHHAKTEDYDLQDEEISIHTLYQAARSAELRITNYYRDIIGARNAIKLSVPAIDAVSWVKVVQPRRIDINKGALDNPVRNDDSLNAFKKNLTNGSASIEAIGKNIETILEKAGIDSDDESGEGWQQMNDLLIGSTLGETLMPDELSLDDESAGDDFNCVPGRVISKQSLATRNIFIDKWYVMGPFENRFRSNLDSSFLPESVVDLDNSTIGKDDKEIKWEYWARSNYPGKPRIEPDWAPRGAIYYAWTEINVEEAGPYWLSLGSDDYGKVWVNGELIWKSDTRPKSYNPAEHTAEVEFKQGINEILFRCENNGGTMGWSVIFHTQSEEEE